MALTQSGPTEVHGDRRRMWLGGGTDGNEQLTTITGSILLVLLAILGVTIVRIGQLLWLHLFLGLLLIGPLVLKLASTGYRFVRYYTRDEPYRCRGPPPAMLRGLAPLLIASTLAVFVTGPLLLAEGPGARDQLLIWHKVSFFVWRAAAAPHVLGHLLELPRWLRATRRDLMPDARRSAGSAGRALAVASAIVAGALLAIILVPPDLGAWTSAHPGEWAPKSAPLYGSSDASVGGWRGGG